MFFFHLLLTLLHYLLLPSESVDNNKVSIVKKSVRSFEKRAKRKVTQPASRTSASSTSFSQHTKNALSLSLRFASTRSFADLSGFFNSIRADPILSDSRFSRDAMEIRRLFRFVSQKNYLTSNFIYLGYHFFLFCVFVTHTLSFSVDLPLRLFCSGKLHLLLSFLLLFLLITLSVTLWNLISL